MVKIDAKTLKKLSHSCAKNRLGAYLFNLALRFGIPYSGSIGAQITEIRPGWAKVRLPDRRKVRNHLNCIHAVALTNLGELTSGLALNMALPDNTRGIVTRLTTEFYKKARGDLIATCRCQLPAAIETDTDFTVVAKIYNAQNTPVAQTTVHWRLSPITERKNS